jgi:hypothetical protein
MLMDKYHHYLYHYELCRTELNCLLLYPLHIIDLSIYRMITNDVSDSYQ